jgi:hypothetical protein
MYAHFRDVQKVLICEGPEFDHHKVTETRGPLWQISISRYPPTDFGGIGGRANRVANEPSYPQVRGRGA